MPVDMNRDSEVIFDVQDSIVIHAMAALHQVARPEPHSSLVEWVGQVRGELTEDELEFVALFQEQHLHGLEMINFLLYLKIFSDLDHFCREFIALEPLEFLHQRYNDLDGEELARAAADPTYLPVLREKYPYQIGDSLPFMEQLFYHSEEFRQNYCQLLGRLKPFVLDYLEGVQQGLEEVSQVVRGLLSKQHPFEVSQTMMGKKFQRVSDYRRYLFAPTPFIAPYKLRIFNQEFLILTFDVNYGKKDQQLPKVKQFIKALDDENRLKMLRQLVRGRSYGKQLAENLNLTTATVSHHLDLFRKLGCIEEERDGNIKYFRADREKVAEYLELVAGYLLEDR